MVCDVCRQPGETALCLGCWRYLDSAHWGSGRHVCKECETALACCGCRGTGCLHLIEREPVVEAESWAS